MYIDRLRLVWALLAEAKLFWIAVGVVVATVLLVCQFPGANDARIRLAGMWLQLLGVCTVIWGIRTTRMEFGHRSYREIASSWLNRVSHALLRRHHTLGAAMSGSAAFSATGTLGAYQIKAAGVGASLEDRIRALEENIQLVHDRISQGQRSVDAKFAEAKSHLGEEAKTRAEEDGRTRAMLEATSTVGIHVSAMGAAWLFVGVILGTASPELFCWLLPAARQCA